MNERSDSEFLTKRAMLPMSDILASYQFAISVVASNVDAYERRGQTHVSKIVQDIARGKFCEFAVASTLRPRPHPDLRVLAPRDKSFDADLVTHTLDIHVKSCLKSRLETSWTFQREDPLLTAPTARDHLALCELDEPVVRFRIVSAQSVASLFREPRDERFKDVKRCLYLSDLEKHASASSRDTAEPASESERGIDWEEIRG